MTNLEKMLQSDNKNIKLFAQTVNDFKFSQGIYGRIERTINELDDNDFKLFYQELEKQDFKDTLDVILWLEEGM